MAPDLRFWNALSVGAKIVKPCEVVFSWLSIWVSCCVSFKRRIRNVYCPPFSRIAVMLIGPEGAGAGASVVWAWAWRIQRVRRISARGVTVVVVLVAMLL